MTIICESFDTCPIKNDCYHGKPHSMSWCDDNGDCFSYCLEEGGVDGSLCVEYNDKMKARMTEYECRDEG